jgi:hypothetical protein
MDLKRSSVGQMLADIVSDRFTVDEPVRRLVSRDVETRMAHGFFP